MYFPTSSARDEEFEDLYCQLESSMAKIPKRELLLITGDINAKVGNTTGDTGIQHIVGDYGHGVRNPRGMRLIDRQQHGQQKPTAMTDRYVAVGHDN